VEKVDVGLKEGTSENGCCGSVVAVAGWQPAYQRNPERKITRSWRGENGAGAGADSNRGCLCCGFGAEDALKAGAGELNADYLFAVGQRFADVDNAALGFEVGVIPAGRVAGRGNADFEIGADGDVEAGAERGSATAEILAGSIFFEGKSAGVAAANP
jgi:hypothetical protein